MKQAWTREEDMIILGGVSTFGNKWSKIVAQLPVHRTDDAVRNRWRACCASRSADRKAEPSPPPLTGVKRAASFDVSAAASADDTAAFAAMMQQHGAGGTPKASGDLPLQPTRALSLPTSCAVDQKGGDMWTAEEDRTIDEGVPPRGAAVARDRGAAARAHRVGVRNHMQMRTQERLFAANGWPRRRRGVRGAPRPPAASANVAPQVGAQPSMYVDLAPASPPPPRERRRRAKPSAVALRTPYRSEVVPAVVRGPSLLGCG